MTTEIENVLMQSLETLQRDWQRSMNQQQEDIDALNERVEGLMKLHERLLSVLDDRHKSTESQFSGLSERVAHLEKSFGQLITVLNK